MAYKMVGKKRVLVDDPPQKTAQPVKATGLLAPVPAPVAAPAASSWEDFAKSYGDTGPIGQLSGVHNSKLFATMANQIATQIGYAGPQSVAGTYQFENANEGGTFTETAQGKQAAPEFLKALESYQFAKTSPTQGAITDNAGQSVGTFTAGNKDTGFDAFAQAAIPIALSALAGGALGGYIPGAEIGAAGSGAAANTAGGLIGAGEGAAQLAAYTAANPLTAAQVVASTLPAGGLPGLASTAGGLLGAGEAASQLAAYSAANPLTAAQVTASTLPAGGLPGLSSGLLASVPAETLASVESFAAANPVTAADLAYTIPQSALPVPGGITSGAVESLNSYSAANPVTMAEVSAGIPEIAAPVSAAPSVFNAAADSQLASSQLGITGAEAAAAATAPATVNLGSLGGTMGTAGGIEGLLSAGKQLATDKVGDIAAWMKNNPQLGRLILGGATSLLSSAGGGSSNSAPAPSGPPVKWNSGLQQGLLAPVQQYAPAAITQNRPAGLLAQGFQNDGAWRYLKG